MQNHENTLLKLITEHNWPIDTPIMVSIVVATYNHEKYISTAIESFLMQRCDFKVEILINDDASTDKTAEIVRSYEQNYPNLFRNFYQFENQYSKGKKPWIDILFPTSKGKYIAICEGDDYWTDPFKLQKQVDFLEKRKEFGFCFHEVEVIDGFSKGKIKDLNEKLLSKKMGVEIKFSSLLNGFSFPIQSLVFNKELLEKDEYLKFKYYRDVHMLVSFLKKKKGYLLNFKGAVYRVHDQGVYNRLNSEEKLTIGYKCYEELYLYHDDVPELKKNISIF